MSLAKKLNLGAEEEILEIIRATALTVWWKYFFGLLILGVASFFLFWLVAQGIWGYIALGAAYLIGLIIIFRTWFFHHFNYLAVTTERILDVDRPKISEETISAVNYPDIQDIYVRKKGFFSNIFNYGAVVIETKNQKFVLEVKDARLPRRLANWLLEVRDNYYKKQRLSNQQAVVSDFVQIISKLSRQDLKNVYLSIEEQIKKTDNQELE